MQENAVEIYNQGYYYYTGTEGYPLNYNKALQCFQKAADLGNSNAMNYLGVIYQDGNIVPKNLELAFGWFNKAYLSDNRNPVPIYNIGRCYYLGWGTQRNIERAITYLKESIRLTSGAKQRIYAMGCYLAGCIMLEEYQDYREAFQYFSEAAEYGGIAEAWHNMGWLCENGHINLTNSNQPQQSEMHAVARQFYEKAVDKGSTKSMCALAHLYMVYDMEKEAMEYLQRACSLGDESAKEMLRKVNGIKNSSLFGLFKYL